MSTLKTGLLVVVLLTATLGGCNCTKAPQQVPVVLQGDEKLTAALQQVLKQNPTIAVRSASPERPLTEYHLEVVEPDPNTDFKIVSVAPDPATDYKIIVIDPGTGEELADLSRSLEDALKQELSEQQRQ